MEVYKITCKINGKVYIGSTKLSKEARWGDLSSRSSHLSCVRDGDTRPLYEDIRQYGPDQFELETLESVKGNRSDAYRREDFWIKKYWNELGAENLYNQNDSACGHHDWSVPHDPDSQAKAAEARRSKYGSANGAAITSEAQAKARITKLARYGTTNPCDMNPDSRKKQAQKVSRIIIDTKDNEELYGYQKVTDKLLAEGYDISFWVVKRMVQSCGNPSERTKRRYPDLVERFIYKE